MAKDSKEEELTQEQKESRRTLSLENILGLSTLHTSYKAHNGSYGDEGKQAAHRLYSNYLNRLYSGEEKGNSYARAEARARLEAESAAAQQGELFNGSVQTNRILNYGAVIFEESIDDVKVSDLIKILGDIKGKDVVLETLKEKSDWYMLELKELDKKAYAALRELFVGTIDAHNMANAYMINVSQSIGVLEKTFKKKEEKEEK